MGGRWWVVGGGWGGGGSDRGRLSEWAVGHSQHVSVSTQANLPRGERATDHRDMRDYANVAPAKPLGDAISPFVPHRWAPHHQVTLVIVIHVVQPIPSSAPHIMSDLSTLADLKAITAEHVNKFDAQGRTAVKGANRRKHIESKDPFDKPSPGLVKRLAAEARNDAKRRVFHDHEAGPSDEQRREIMLAKANKYEALKKGDYSGLSAKELEEGVLDVRDLRFDRLVGIRLILV